MGSGIGGFQACQGPQALGDDYGLQVPPLAACPKSPLHQDHPEGNIPQDLVAVGNVAGSEDQVTWTGVTNGAGKGESGPALQHKEGVLVDIRKGFGGGAPLWLVLQEEGTGQDGVCPVVSDWKIDWPHKD